MSLLRELSHEQVPCGLGGHRGDRDGGQDGEGGVGGRGPAALALAVLVAAVAVAVAGIDAARNSILLVLFKR